MSWQAMVFAAGVASIGVMAHGFRRALPAILDALFPHHAPPVEDRWRRVHLEADRRPPLPRIRARSSRRGLLGRWSR